MPQNNVLTIRTLTGWCWFAECDCGWQTSGACLDVARDAEKHVGSGAGCRRDRVVVAA